MDNSITIKVPNNIDLLCDIRDTLEKHKIRLDEKILEIRVNILDEDKLGIKQAMSESLENILEEKDMILKELENIYYYTWL